jgi:hypothetical protein
MRILWIVEAKCISGDEWHPTLGFTGIPGAHRIRAAARDARRRMYKTNIYNQGTMPAVQYRVTKYVAVR